MKKLGLHLLIFFTIFTWFDLLAICLLVNLSGFDNISIIDKIVMVVSAVGYFVIKFYIIKYIRKSWDNIIFMFQG